MRVAPPRDLARHRRIALHGVTGSGKSALARRVADAGGLPFVDVDGLMWRPGWVERPKDAQAGVILPVVEQDAWVLDSLWATTRPVVLPRLDLLVALDYPRHVSLGRLLRRTLRRLVTRELACGGNVESWRQVLSRDSIVVWHFRSFRRKREQIGAWEADPAGPPVLRFTRPADADAWVRALGRHPEV
ncbi:MAG: adenylate kinase [Phycicoccus sp.]